MRMTRFEWFQRLMLGRQSRRAAKIVRSGSGRPKLIWRYRGLECRAYTRSEARAYFKGVFGLKRIPAGETPELVWR